MEVYLSECYGLAVIILPHPRSSISINKWEIDVCMFLHCMIMYVAKERDIIRLLRASLPRAIHLKLVSPFLKFLVEYLEIKWFPSV